MLHAYMLRDILLHPFGSIRISFHIIFPEMLLPRVNRHMPYRRTGVHALTDSDSYTDLDLDLDLDPDSDPMLHLSLHCGHVSFFNFSVDPIYLFVKSLF